MRDLVRFYFAFLDGECAVERDLGEVRAEAAEHCKGVADGDCALLDEKLQIQALPKAALEYQAGYGLTPILRQCLRLWRARFGARFGGYKKPRGPDKPPIKKRPAATGTYACVRRGVLRAAEAERRRADRPVPGDPVTIYGDARSHFARRAADARKAASPFWNKRRADFRKATDKKQVQARIATSRIRLGVDAMPPLTTRRAGSVAKGLVGISRVCFVGGREVGAASPTVSVVEGPERVRYADLVIADSLEKLFRPRSASAAVDFTYVVGLGRPVVAWSVWEAAHGVPSAIPAAEVFRVKRNVHQAAKIRLGPDFKSEHPTIHAAFSAMEQVAAFGSTGFLRGRGQGLGVLGCGRGSRWRWLPQPRGGGVRGLPQPRGGEGAAWPGVIIIMASAKNPARRRTASGLLAKPQMRSIWMQPASATSAVGCRSGAVH